ncbi:MAG: hypothetical protein RSB39_06015 [Oscillospiraceae bacterium]
MAKTSNTVIESGEAAFSKELLLRSQKYAGRRDLLCALLEDGRTYTTQEVDEIISEFMKGKVI